MLTSACSDGCWNSAGKFCGRQPGTARILSPRHHDGYHRHHRSFCIHSRQQPQQFISKRTRVSRWRQHFRPARPYIHQSFSQTITISQIKVKRARPTQAAHFPECKHVPLLLLTLHRYISTPVSPIAPRQFSPQRLPVCLYIHVSLSYAIRIIQANITLRTCEKT